jgi:GH24 family phage-related lysozyme (muramidase)
LSEEIHYPDGSTSFTIGGGHELNHVIIREQCNRVTSKAIEAQHLTIDFDAVLSYAKKFHKLAQ